MCGLTVAPAYMTATRPTPFWLAPERVALSAGAGVVTAVVVTTVLEMVTLSVPYVMVQSGATQSVESNVPVYSPSTIVLVTSVRWRSVRRLLLVAPAAAGERATAR